METICCCAIDLPPFIGLPVSVPESSKFDQPVVPIVAEVEHLGVLEAVDHHVLGGSPVTEQVELIVVVQQFATDPGRLTPS
jgi:hypothetical protein